MVNRETMNKGQSSWRAGIKMRTLKCHCLRCCWPVGRFHAHSSSSSSLHPPQDGLPSAYIQGWNSSIYRTLFRDELCKLATSSLYCCHHPSSIPACITHRPHHIRFLPKPPQHLPSTHWHKTQCPSWGLQCLTHSSLSPCLKVCLLSPVTSSVLVSILEDTQWEWWEMPLLGDNKNLWMSSKV